MKSLIEKLVGDHSAPTLFLLASYSSVESISTQLWIPRGPSTPLIAAATMDNTEVFEFLVNQGYNPGECDEFGRCSAWYAAKHGSGGVLRFLAKNCPVTFNYADDWGACALHVAQLEMVPNLLQVMLDAGADPNARDAEGATPLHRALRGGWMESALALIRSGANPYSKDRHGLNALRIAQGMGYPTQDLEGAWTPAVDWRNFRPRSTMKAS